MGKYETTAGALSLENMNMNSTIDTASASLMYHEVYNGWTPAVNTIYRSYWPAIHEDTFKKAFKIVSMMIEKGHLKNIRLKDFIKIVKEVESEL